MSISVQYELQEERKWIQEIYYLTKSQKLSKIKRSQIKGLMEHQTKNQEENKALTHYSEI